MSKRFSAGLSLISAALGLACGEGEPENKCFEHASPGEDGECVCEAGWHRWGDSCVPSLDCQSDVVVTPSRLDYGDVTPSGDRTSLKVQLENRSQQSLQINRISVVTEDGACGQFVMEEPGLGKMLPVGDTLERTVTFVPNPACGPGCDCHAFGRFFVELHRRHQCRVDSTPLMAFGECAEPLRCGLRMGRFGGATINHTYAGSVLCHNLGEEPVEVRSASLAATSSASFSLSRSEPKLPATLGFLGTFEAVVSFSPTDRGAHHGQLVIDVGSRGRTTIDFSGLANRKRPLCSDGVPAHPQPVLLGPNYTISLEAPSISAHEGAVRAQWFYVEPPMMSDIAIGTGEFASPSCEAGQQGHMAWWRGCNPNGGEFKNIHAIPHSPQVDIWVRGLQTFEYVKFFGYEVDRVTYDDGRYWQDAGCNTMVLTWICDEQP